MEQPGSRQSKPASMKIRSRPSCSACSLTAPEPGTIQALSLVLHELATNAAKYGALSVPGGHVKVGWRMNEDGRQLHLSWIESGGPPVSEPTTTGYGTQLIHSAMTYSLGGRVDQKYAPSGVETEIVIPLPQASLEK